MSGKHFSQQNENDSNEISATFRSSAAALNKIRITRDKHERYLLIQKLAQIQKPWVSTTLLKALNDPCEKIRDFLIDELSRRDDCPMEKLYHSLNCPPWYYKSSCLKILGRKKDPQSVKHIESVLNDNNTDVKRSAAHALGEIGGQEALALLSKLITDKNAFVRSSAEKALRKTSSVKFC